MKKLSCILFLLFCMSAQAVEASSLAKGRISHKTSFSTHASSAEPIPEPPKDIFSKTTYKSGALKLPILISVDPNDQAKHPAIVWITGGESNSLGNMWEEAPFSNDQSASQYRDAGVILALPGLRGGNDNPGKIEFNYGEVDDIIAAAQQVSKLPYVDPEKIYLGGHSTGGTLVLLTSEVVSQTHPKLFKGVFSFGATSVTINEQMYDNVKLKGRIEIGLRAPILWLQDIRVPTWLIEGHDGNLGALKDLCEKGKNNKFIHCVPVSEHSHFTVLAPANIAIAKSILSGKVKLTEEMIHANSK